MNHLKHILITGLLLAALSLSGCNFANTQNTGGASSSSSQATSSVPLGAVRSEANGGASGALSQASSAASSTASATSSVVSGTASRTASAATSSARQSVKVTVPEGYSFMQIAGLLESKGVCTKQAFYDAAQRYTVQSFTVPASSDRCFALEGYLYPDTYEFYRPEEPVEVLRKMLNNYAAQSGMPSDKTLIIASIVEKEARSTENMRLVASVLWNRLNYGMNLQADCTRTYVNSYITGNALLGDTTKYPGLYNTYKCALPAGPICNPGSRAIAAAQNPPDTNYFYFFFGNDNQNHYAQTFEEHEAQKAEFGVQYE